MTHKPRLSFWQIINMNVGFFGIQYSFGLQQSAVNPIYDFLGAKPDEIPWLNLAGPLTGLLVQPILGIPGLVEESLIFLLVPLCVVWHYSYFRLVVVCGWLQVYCGY
jgi:hypothetical protein